MTGESNQINTPSDSSTVEHIGTTQLLNPQGKSPPKEIIKPDEVDPREPIRIEETIDLSKNDIFETPRRSG
jgi:hypothetical protein